MNDQQASEDSKILSSSTMAVNSVETVIVTGNVLGAGVDPSAHTGINFSVEFSHLFEKLHWINNPTHAVALFTTIAGGMWIGYAVGIFIQELFETIRFYEENEVYKAAYTEKQKKTDEEIAEYTLKQKLFLPYLLARIICLNLTVPFFVILMGLSMPNSAGVAGLALFSTSAVLILLVHVAPIILILYALWQLVKNNNDEQDNQNAPLAKLLKNALLLLLIVLMLATLYIFSTSFFIAAIILLVLLAAIALYFNKPDLNHVYKNKQLKSSLMVWAVLAVITITLLALYLAAPAILAITFSTLVFSAIALSLLIIAMSVYLIYVLHDNHMKKQARTGKKGKLTKELNIWLTFRHYLVVLSVAAILLILIGFYVFAPALLFIALVHVVLLIFTISLSIHSTIDIYRTYIAFNGSIFAMHDWVLGVYITVSAVLLLAALIVATLPLYAPLSLVMAFSIVCILLGFKLFIIFLSNISFCYKLSGAIWINNFAEIRKHHENTFSAVIAMSPAYLALAAAFMVIGSLYCLSIISAPIVVPVLLAAILFFLATEIRTKIVCMGASQKALSLDGFASGAAVMLLAGIVALMVIYAIAPVLLIASAIAVASAFIGYCLFYLGHMKFGNTITEMVLSLPCSRELLNNIRTHLGQLNQSTEVKQTIKEIDNILKNNDENNNIDNIPLAHKILKKLKAIYYNTSDEELKKYIDQIGQDAVEFSIEPENSVVK